MDTKGMTSFETAIGRMGIRWNERGIASIRWAAGPDAAPPSDPPRGVREAIAGITALLGGRGGDLSSVSLDFDRVEPFDRRVYELARGIRPGETRSYGELARSLGEPDARRVGAALARNPFPIVVPCHRVVAADGGMGGFSAPGGVATKRRLLAIESAYADESQTLFGVR
ncbi:MAG: methylated-DNA--[protein]-cysteine S-methyltransferase [Solirubrobacterales bacterium]